MINISFLEVPHTDDKKLKDAMFYTAQPLYKNKDIEFTNLHRMVSSDYRQYSPFKFEENTKKSENWNNESQQLIILDVDDGLSILEAKEAFKEYKYLICTTKSHQVLKKDLKCDRFRIILESDDIPKGEDYFVFTKGLEAKYPFIDKQVNTKTGAFLGSAKCEYWYNEGNLFKCTPIFEKQQYLNQITPVGHKAIIESSNNNDNAEVTELKEALTQETISHILNANGFDVDRNFKLKLREERTPSASISRNGLIKDFGTDFASDIFGVLMEYRGMDFPKAIEEVRKYA